jgi:large subunit ribosomal protein L25
MEKIQLKAEKRTLFGKKAKKLRRDGLIAGNMSGKGIESLAVTVKKEDFVKTYKKAHGTHIVELVVDGKSYPTLIQNLHKNHAAGTVMHVDFRHVSLKEKTQAEVPVVVTGELAEVKSGDADMLVLMDTITVECFPDKIPENITIDISTLSGIGAEVKVQDLPKSSNYTYMDEADKTIVQIAAAKKEEIVAPTADTETVVAEATEQKSPEELAAEAAAKATEEKKE